MKGGLYVHIPFCGSRCAYCGFFTGGERLADWSRFRESLARELSSRSGEMNFQLATCYFGGGTPSLMPADELSRLAKELEVIWRQATGEDFSPEEFTVEANPESVTEEKAVAWADAGVNRVSMGIQSMQEDELTVLGRRHRPGDVERAIEILGRHFCNISLDIMYGIPCQTPESLDDTLRKLFAFRPTHLSAYELMYDPSTLLTFRRDSGALEPMEEERVVELYTLLGERLSEEGFRHYEVSNYALAGMESRHNNLYWSGNPYIGLGPGASSYDGRRCRRNNPGLLREYLERGVEPEVEILTDEELFEEYILTRLRTARGIDLGEIESRFGVRRREGILKKAKAMQKEGVLVCEGRRLHLSERGFLLLDRAILSLSS